MSEGMIDFSGVGDAKASFDAVYCGRGHYLLRIDNVKTDQNRTKRRFVAVEMTVLHTFDDGDGHIDTAIKSTWHQPGASVSDIMMQDSDYFLGDLKAFIANVAGISQAEVTPKRCSQVTDPKGPQPFAGLVVEMRNRQKPTRPTTQNPQGGVFTKRTYVREWKASEFSELLSDKILDIHFPGDAIERLVAEEAE